jgi:tryptophan-rich sensory protein
MQRSSALAASLGGVASAAAFGGRFGPQTPRRAAWYAALRKPDYTPSGPVIGAAWGGLDILLCVTGYRLLRQPPGRARGVALGCWTLALGGLAGFPAVFFGRRRLGEGTAVAAGMCAAALGGTLAAARVDRTAAAAQLPLVLWTGFATLLSAALWRRNRAARWR